MKAPDEHDCKKLRRFIQYLRSTVQLSLTLEADDGHVIKWWIDTVIAAHPDVKSQSGRAMSLEMGMAYSSSIRQNLNTKSSTEAKLFGTNDFMPQILWIRYFLDA